MRDKITNEMRRYKQFQQMLLGKEEKVTVRNIDIRNYAKFILQEDDVNEKEFFEVFKKQHHHYQQAGTFDLD